MGRRDDARWRERRPSGGEARCRRRGQLERAVSDIVQMMMTLETWLRSEMTGVREESGSQDDLARGQMASMLARILLSCKV